MTAEHQRKYREAHREEYNTYQREWAKRNKDKVHPRIRAWIAANRDKVREYHRKNREANRDKYRARATVRRAVLKGRLVVPLGCEACHEHKRLHAHHDDYSAPLEVRWLCPQCHKNIHPG